MQAPPPRNYDAVCFLAQQCAEKYVKARLQEAGVAFPKTHDLETLLTLAVGIEPGWRSLRRSLGLLSGYAVDFRYPGMTASESEAVEAMMTAGSVRNTVRQSLGLGAE